ncbi:MAG: TetR family transcriptional regulator [Actinomycetia bacterium]|nr:TetR family transcriptional regulator [Actinomycetes bacterium]
MTDAPRRGRPRSEQSRVATLDATAELLLAHGLGGVSVDAIAERAGVSKATIYRWWPTKELLALDALYRSWASVEPEQPDTGSLRGDLVELLVPWAARLRGGSYGELIAAFVIEAHRDAAFAEAYHARFVHPRRELGRAAFARAEARGEVPDRIKVEVALDLLYGPVYHRLLHRHAPLDDDFVVDVIDGVLGGVVALR